MYLNTSKLLITGLFVFQVLGLMYSDFLFNLLQQPHDAVEVAQTYIISVLPGTLLSMHFECTRRYLLAMGVYTPILYTMIVTLPIHVISLYLFLFVFDLKIAGVAFASAITYSLNFGVLNFYIYRNAEIVKSEKWFFMDREA